MVYQLDMTAGNELPRMSKERQQFSSGTSTPLDLSNPAGVALRSQVENVNDCGPLNLSKNSKNVGNVPKAVQAEEKLQSDSWNGNLIPQRCVKRKPTLFTNTTLSEIPQRQNHSNTPPVRPQQNVSEVMANLYGVQMSDRIDASLGCAGNSSMLPHWTGKQETNTLCRLQHTRQLRGLAGEEQRKNGFQAGRLPPPVPASKCEITTSILDLRASRDYPEKKATYESDLEILKAKNAVEQLNSYKKLTSLLAEKLWQLQEAQKHMKVISRESLFELKLICSLEYEEEEFISALATFLFNLCMRQRDVSDTVRTCSQQLHGKGYRRPSQSRVRRHRHRKANTKFQLKDRRLRTKCSTAADHLDLTADENNDVTTPVRSLENITCQICKMSVTSELEMEQHIKSQHLNAAFPLNNEAFTPPFTAASKEPHISLYNNAGQDIVQVPQMFLVYDAAVAPNVSASQPMEYGATEQLPLIPSHTEITCHNNTESTPLHSKSLTQILLSSNELRRNEILVATPRSISVAKNLTPEYGLVSNQQQGRSRCVKKQQGASNKHGPYYNASNKYENGSYSLGNRHSSSQQSSFNNSGLMYTTPGNQQSYRMSIPRNACASGVVPEGADQVVASYQDTCKNNQGVAPSAEPMMAVRRNSCSSPVGQPYVPHKAYRVSYDPPIEAVSETESEEEQHKRTNILEIALKTAGISSVHEAVDSTEISVGRAVKSISNNTENATEKDTQIASGPDPVCFEVIEEGTAPGGRTITQVLRNDHEEIVSDKDSESTTICQSGNETVLDASAEIVSAVISEATQNTTVWTVSGVAVESADSHNAIQDSTQAVTNADSKRVLGCSIEVTTSVVGTETAPDAVTEARVTAETVPDTSLAPVGTEILTKVESLMVRGITTEMIRNVGKTVPCVDRDIVKALGVNRKTLSNDGVNNIMPGVGNEKLLDTETELFPDASPDNRKKRITVAENDSNATESINDTAIADKGLSYLSIGDKGQVSVVTDERKQEIGQFSTVKVLQAGTDAELYASTHETRRDGILSGVQPRNVTPSIARSTASSGQLNLATVAAAEKVTYHMLKSIEQLEMESQEDGNDKTKGADDPQRQYSVSDGLLGGSHIGSLSTKTIIMTDPTGIEQTADAEKEIFDATNTNYSPCPSTALKAIGINTTVTCFNKVLEQNTKGSPENKPKANLALQNTVEMEHKKLSQYSYNHQEETQRNQKLEKWDDVNSHVGYCQGSEDLGISTKDLSVSCPTSHSDELSSDKDSQEYSSDSGEDDHQMGEDDIRGRNLAQSSCEEETDRSEESSAESEGNNDDTRRRNLAQSSCEEETDRSEESSAEGEGNNDDISGRNPAQSSCEEETDRSEESSAESEGNNDDTRRRNLAQSSCEEETDRSEESSAESEGNNDDTRRRNLAQSSCEEETDRSEQSSAESEGNNEDTGMDHTGTRSADQIESALTLLQLSWIPIRNQNISVDGDRDISDSTTHATIENESSCHQTGEKSESSKIKDVSESTMPGNGEEKCVNSQEERSVGAVNLAAISDQQLLSGADAIVSSVMYGSKKVKKLAMREGAHPRNTSTKNVSDDTVLKRTVTSSSSSSSSANLTGLGCVYVDKHIGNTQQNYYQNASLKPKNSRSKGTEQHKESSKRNLTKRKKGLKIKSPSIVLQRLDHHSIKMIENNMQISLPAYVTNYFDMKLRAKRKPTYRPFTRIRRTCTQRSRCYVDDRRTAECYQHRIHRRPTHCSTGGTKEDDKNQKKGSCQLGVLKGTRFHGFTDCHSQERSHEISDCMDFSKNENSYRYTESLVTVKDTANDDQRNGGINSGYTGGNRTHSPNADHRTGGSCQHSGPAKDGSPIFSPRIANGEKEQQKEHQHQDSDGEGHLHAATEIKRKKESHPHSLLKNKRKSRNNPLRLIMDCSITDTTKSPKTPNPRNYDRSQQTNPVTELVTMDLPTRNEGVKIPPEKQRLVCLLCGERMTSSEAAKKHAAKQHILLKPYGCPHCKIKTCLREWMEQHILTEHKDGRSSVLINQRLSRLQGQMALHCYVSEGMEKEATHTLVKLRKYEHYLNKQIKSKVGRKSKKKESDTAFMDQETVRKMSKCRFPSEKYECVLCGHKDLCEARMMRHTLQHLFILPYSCSLCRAEFKTKKLARDHIRSTRCGAVAGASLVEKESEIERQEVLTRNMLVTASISKSDRAAKYRSLIQVREVSKIPMQWDAAADTPPQNNDHIPRPDTGVSAS